MLLKYSSDCRRLFGVLFLGDCLGPGDSWKTAGLRATLEELSLFAICGGFAGSCVVLMPQLCSNVLGGVEALKDGASSAVGYHIGRWPNWVVSSLVNDDW